MFGTRERRLCREKASLIESMDVLLMIDKRPFTHAHLYLPVDIYIVTIALPDILVVEERVFIQNSVIILAMGKLVQIFDKRFDSHHSID